MNHPTINGVQVQRQSCGRTAVENDARAFWQSRMTNNGKVAELVQLTDIRALAKAVRTCYEEAP